MRMCARMIVMLLMSATLLTAARAQNGGASRADVVPPGGFKAILLGMELDEVKAELRRDTNFRFRGDPDVSLLQRPNEALVETEGYTFIRRAYFQFRDRRLHTIILELDRTRMDHYSMYTTLTGRYGEPTALSPAEAVWEFPEVRLSLERPLSVKYIDRAALNRLVRERSELESLEQLNRDRFLDQF